jgi:nucleoside-diphosphate-sugar epimerase
MGSDATGGRKVAIIGAGGWIGRALAAQAASLVGFDAVRLFGSSDSQISVLGHELEVEGLTHASNLKGEGWTVLHAGIVGLPAGEGLDKALESNRQLMSEVLRLSEAADRLMLVSSGAVGRLQAGAAPAGRLAYAQMKLEQEERASDWASGRRTQLSIPRVFNLGGPYINQLKSYALSDFILQAVETGRVHIGAGHRVLRSYVHVSEFARAMLGLLETQNEARQIIDIAGSEAVELTDLAQLVLEALGLPRDAIDRTRSDGAEDRYVGDPQAYQALLARLGLQPVSTRVTVGDTIDFLRREGQLSA